MPLADLVARFSKLVVLSYIVDWVFIVYANDLSPRKTRRY